MCSPVQHKFMYKNNGKSGVKNPHSARYDGFNTIFEYLHLDTEDNEKKNVNIDSFDLPDYVNKCSQQKKLR